MKKGLILYFSRADENWSVGVIDKGNTEIVAEYIKEKTGSDIFKVERRIPYAKDYDTCCKEAKEEQTENIYPELVSYLDKIDEYDTIYIGTPIYWGTLARPLFTQINLLNWEGKTVKPFCTHEGSYMANVINDLKVMCKGATVEEGLAIKGSEVKQSFDQVDNWLEN